MMASKETAQCSERCHCALNLWEERAEVQPEDDLSVLSIENDFNADVTERLARDCHLSLRGDLRGWN